MRTLKASDIKHDIEPFIGLHSSVILGTVATCATLLIARNFHLASSNDSLIITGAIATIFAGFIILATRYKAISQIMGYLMMENGIFIFGMLLVDTLPLVVELGVLLDLFAGVFAVSIITNQINRAFSSTDTRQLVSLKED
jgi:hydrogenase-4 component E